MDLEIKKDLTSNWFRLLQDELRRYPEFRKSKTKFETTEWKRNQSKDEGGGSIGF